MAAAPPPWPHAATVTENCFSFLLRGKGVVNVTRNPSDDACSLRLRGDLILSHRSRRFGPNGWFVDDVAYPVVRKLDHWLKVYHYTVFQCIEVCSDSILRMLDVAPATREYDLATGSWVEPIYTPHPHDIAAAIVRFVGREIREIWDAADSAVPMVRPVFPGYDVDIEIPQLCVSFDYTEPKQLILACKEPVAETVAARVSARRRKRRREPAGELCAICLLDFLETEEEEAVRLPCSHPFHGGCIETWLRRALTCPTCRRDVMQCFGFVR